MHMLDIQPRAPFHSLRRLPAKAWGFALLLCAGLLAGGCKAPNAGSEVLRGHLSMGPDGEQFLPCGSEQALRLQAPDELAERLQAQYLAQVGEPYEEAFAQLRGQPDGRDEVPSLRVEQILKLQPAAAQDCR